MTRYRLRIAGSLAMTSAILSIPFLLLSYHLAGADQMTDIIFQAAIQLLGLFLFVFPIATFKQLLNSSYTFHDTDNYIDFLVTINLFFTAAYVAGLFLPSLQAPLNQFSLMLMVVFGGAQIMFAIKLLGLKDPLNGLLKPYCFLSILTGMLIASVILMPLGIITGAITEVMLGTIFFQAGTNPHVSPTE